MLWGMEVGIVQHSQFSGYSFTYAPEWIATGIQPSPLVMPAKRGSFAFRSLNPETYQGLPGMIADALPDKFGNAVIDAYMSQRGINAASITALQRLAYIGRRATGALEFEPVLESTEDQAVYSEPLAMKHMIESARKVISGQPVDALSQLLEVGSSAGGARAKAVVGYNPVSGDLVSGQFDLPQGFEHYLIKFDGVEGASGVYGRRESAYLSMAKSAGINTPDHFLLSDEDRAHLMVKRFDRTNTGEKLHMQTFCGLAHVDFNQRMTTEYGMFLRTINALGLDTHSLEEGFRRMVFNVAGVNCDDHTKNISFLMNKDGGWSLSPAYDIGFAWNPKADHWTNQHQMLVNGKGWGITRNDLHQVAAAVSIKPNRANELIDEVLAAFANWMEFATQAGMKENDSASIMQKQKEAMSWLDGNKKNADHNVDDGLDEPVHLKHGIRPAS